MTRLLARSGRTSRRGVYTGRKKVGPDHPLVKKTEKALLSFIKRGLDTEFTVVPATGTTGTCYMDRHTGTFGTELLLPNFTKGEDKARELLQTHVNEMTKPIASWFTISRFNKLTGEEEAEQADEPTEEQAEV
jgi:hypothetical protein